MITKTAKVGGVFRIAEFSDCMLYRNSLRIIWDLTRNPKMFVGLNPSTADQDQDDPTVRRCIDYAKRWGCGGLVMANACSYRATDPKVMLSFTGYPIGPENTIEYLKLLAAFCAGRPIAAWGKNLLKVHGGKGQRVNRHDLLIRAIEFDCLRVNKDGTPAHPLYLPATLMPAPFNYGKGETNAWRGDSVPLV